MTFDFYLIMAYVLTIFLFLSTPGPVTLLVVNASLSGGFRAGLATVIGTNIASLILIFVSFFVIQGLFTVSETALSWLTLIGSFYILLFSYRMVN